MKRLGIIASLFVMTSPLLADGLLSLKTIEKKGVVAQQIPGVDLRVRANASASLSRSMGGSTGTFVPVNPSKTTAKEKLYDLPPGRYFNATTNRTFNVIPAAAMGPLR
jgi:hypothetical protein